MIREKIFRLHRHKSSSSSAGPDASGCKFDFTFSNIQAIQVPKGWDKVSLSLISSESGKPVRKTGKAAVRNGVCHWTDTFSESIWISDVDTLKELDQYRFKFLVTSGSSKSSVLGEAVLDPSACLSSECPTVVSLPLNKCSYRTMLQVEVKCLTPKTNLREAKWKNMQENKDENADHNNIENQSEISDCSESISSNNTTSSSRPRELCSRESFSASVGRSSFDSMDDSVERQSFSSLSDRNGGNSFILRQDSIESNGSSTSVRSSLQRNVCSSKTFKDATVQGLEAEARMWEQNARKLSVDLERLRKELSDQNVNVANLNIELERSHSECDELTKEIGRLKSLLDEACMKQRVDMQKELEDELRFQKEENGNFSLQLKKTQDSNIELISVLQEMEETIDKQKLEIERLSMADTDEQIQQRENMQKAQLDLQGELLVLESTLQDKIISNEIEQDLISQVLMECVLDCNARLAANNEEKIGHTDVSEDVRLLKEKIQELEKNIELRKEYESVMDEKEMGVVSYHKINELRMVGSENSQTELNKHMFDLQEENIYLLQRVSGLEAQLRYLTDKNESSCLDLRHSESKVEILENGIRRLEEEIESEKLDAKQKLLAVEKQWIETREECKALSILNIRLQATTENLVEEYNYLQKFNGEIREEKIKLKNECLVLESDARKRRYELHENIENSQSENSAVLAANQEEVLTTYEDKMNGGPKRKSIIDELESEIKFSEVERLRLAEENTLLHMQLEKVEELQNEVLALRISLKEMKSQNQILEASFKSLSKDYEELKSENISTVEKFSTMEKAVSEAEECRRKKNALEEKALRLEGDLIARDALFLQDVETKNELSWIKIENSQLLMKVKCLEQELKKAKHSRSTSAFRHDNRELVKVFNEADSYSRRDQVPIIDYESRIQLLERELGEALKANDVYKSQLESWKTEEMLVVERELQEIRGRYLEMSLKYAQVEAQREELVMKLKALNA